MEKSFNKVLAGYRSFRKKYASGDNSIMRSLAINGQNPEVMVVACSDSRVDPALILQCDPGDLFVVRNVANIVPPYEKDERHHGTSAALEFGIKYLKVKHLILLGHSQCGGIQTLVENRDTESDFIRQWVNIIKPENFQKSGVDDCAKQALKQSYENCLTFPWIKKSITEGSLIIHLWFFDIQSSEIFAYDNNTQKYLSFL